ncbi:MAG: hypothetical protein CM1200mP18_10880 [Gammaproteobacteria bacterium]|nr:MAG: hypothetical protein CM1200mP18_10880 [Gammaproteobacteria bacterium]
MINNAGIYGGERQSFGDIDYAQWARVLEVNTLGPYRVSTALANQVEKGEQRLMVNVSSAMGSIERYTTVGTTSTAAVKLPKYGDRQPGPLIFALVALPYCRCTRAGYAQTWVAQAPIFQRDECSRTAQLISNATTKTAAASFPGTALPCLGKLFAWTTRA